jgi:hypothetical protein
VRPRSLKTLRPGDLEVWNTEKSENPENRRKQKHETEKLKANEAPIDKHK